MIKFTIPLPPATKKNSLQILTNKKTGKPFVAQSSRYKEYEKAAVLYMPKINTITEPCEVCCVFYMPTKRRVDLTNLLEAVDDIMVRAKVLEDDNYKVIQSHDGSRVKVDKDNPRTEVKIRILSE